MNGRTFTQFGEELQLPSKMALSQPWRIGEWEKGQEKSKQRLDTVGWEFVSWWWVDSAQKNREQNHVVGINDNTEWASI